MNETKQKGLITEIQCELAFSKLGILLSKPIAEDSRYDYLADIGNKFLRIQCKTSSLANDNSYIEFATRSARSNTKENFTRNYTKKEIDYFYTCYNNTSYLVPVEECSTSKKLRFTPTKSGQIKGINFAKDFELKKILMQRENFINFKESQINIIKDNNNHNNNCKICGKSITDNAELCVECKNIAQRTVQRPNREELKSLIRNISFVQLGKNFNVSDSAIKKWCDYYKLPRKKKDILSYNDQEWKEI